MKKQIWLLLLFFGIVLEPLARDINIGVIYDDIPREVRVELGGIFRRELDKNFQNTQFKPVIKREVTTELNDIKGTIEDLDKDKDIEVIYFLGVNPNGYLRKKSLTKMVFAPFSYGNMEKNYKENLNTIDMNYDFKDILVGLEAMTQIENIGIIFSEDFEEVAMEYNQKMLTDDFFSKKKIENILLTSTDVSPKIKEKDALLILARDTALLEKTTAEANNLGILTFSFFFETKNSLNLLMGYSSKEERDRRIRAGVVNLLKYYEGRDSELVTNLPTTNLNMFIDYEVAEAMDIYPNEFLNENIKVINKNKDEGEEITLEKAIKKLLDENTELKARKKNVISKKYDVDIARSKIKPDLSATTNYKKLDNTRSKIDTTTAENTVRGGIKLTQILYDDDTFSNITVEKSLYNAEIEELREEELDQIQNLIVSYINILKSQANFEIEKYNGDLLRKYLGVAKSKNIIGTRGPEDIYRFESELADSEGSLEGINSNIISGNAELNRLLNLSMENEFYLIENGMEDIINLSIFREFETEINRPWNFNKMQNHFIDMGLINSPQLKIIDSQLEAAERKMKAAKRKRYMPTLTADATYDKDLTDPWGEGSHGVDSDKYWSVGIGFSLPLYTGGEIETKKSQIQTDLEKLELEKESMTLIISKEISSQYGEVMANYKKIIYAKRSMEAARKNLDLQTDLYIKGKISVTDIIDARNSFIGASERTTSTKFDFFISLAQLEKLSGKYYFESSDEEKEKNNTLIESLIISREEVK